MLRRVKLERLPDGLSFPEQMADRIAYDPVAGELQFRGFMSKTDFDKLIRLHNDIGYQRALERLFQICTYEPESDTSRRPMMLIVLGTTIAIVALSVAAAFVLAH